MKFFACVLSAVLACSGCGGGGSGDVSAIHKGRIANAAVLKEPSESRKYREIVVLFDDGTIMRGDLDEDHTIPQNGQEVIAMLDGRGDITITLTGLQVSQQVRNREVMVRLEQLLEELSSKPIPLEQGNTKPVTYEGQEPPPTYDD